MTSSARSTCAGPKSGSGAAMAEVEPIPRGRHEAELAELLEEMTMVRRSDPGAEW